MTKCKYCGYKLNNFKKGCLNTDGKHYHKRCLEIITKRERNLNQGGELNENE